MKTSFVYGVMALLASAATAQATGSHDVKLFRFDFDCEFGEEQGPAAQPKPEPEKDKRFEASARVFAFARDDDKFSSVQEARNFVNLLSVSSRDELIYANGALLDSERKFVRILGLGGTPAIIIPRHDHDDVGTEWMEHKAFLRIGDRRIRGECKVRARPVDDDLEVQQSALSTPLN